MSEPQIPNILLRAPDTGEVISVPAARAPEYLAQRFKPLTASEAQFQQRVLAPPDLMGQAAAFGEGALGSVLPIVGPALERVVVDPEDILRREEQFPAAHAAGSVAGVLAPALGQLGLFGKGVQAASAFTAPTAIARAGERAAGALTGRLAAGVAGPATPFAASALGRITAAATDMGVQSALFASGEIGNRAILQDPSLTAEHILREVKDASVFGAVLGGAGSAAVSALRGLYGPAVHGLGTLGVMASKESPDVAEFVITHRPEIEAFAKKVPGGTPTLMQFKPAIQLQLLQNPEAAAGIFQIKRAVESLGNATPATAKFILDNANVIVKNEKHVLPGLLEVISGTDPHTAQTILSKWGTLPHDPGQLAILMEKFAPAIRSEYKGVDGAVKTFWGTTRKAEIQKLLREGVSVENADGSTSWFFVPREKAKEIAEEAGARVRNRIMELRGDMGGEGLEALDQATRDRLVAERGARIKAPDRPMYDTTAIRHLENVHAEFEAKLATLAHPDDVFTAIRTLRRELDPKGLAWADDATNNIKTATRGKVRELYTELNSILKSPKNFGTMAERETVLTKLESRFIDAREAYEEAFMSKKLGDVDLGKVERYLKATGQGGGLRYNMAVDEFLSASRALSDEMKKSGHDVGAMRALLDQTATRASNLRSDGTLQALVKALKRDGFEAMQMAEVSARSEAMHAAGYLGVSGLAKRAVQVLELLRSPYVVAGALNAMDHIAGAAQRALDSSVAHIFQSMGAKAVAEVVDHTAFEPFTAHNYEARSAMWNRAASNPEYVAQGIEERLGPTVTVFPPISGWLHVKMTGKAQHMSKQGPKPVKMGMLDPAYRPSASELQTLNRHAEVAHDPYVVAKKIASGRMTEDHKQALDAMWPATAQKLRVAVLHKLSDLGPEARKLPRATQLGLSQFLGIQLDGSASPHATLGTQRLYQSQVTPPQAAPVNERKIKNVEMKHTQMMATSTQATTRHLENHS
jgi:hypothetical protein